ncbi:rhamnan synthesis F family protein [Muricoccus radiodurans]|uniref:rhamnan synthesis F family protein n=1 Tax=Muricoccus radiodurans TaxID=2231721 RepID=UPI003CE90154
MIAIRHRLPQDAAQPLTPALSPVVDRPDRSLDGALRLRAFLGRPSFRGSLVRAVADLTAGHLRAVVADLLERMNLAPPIRSFDQGAVPLDRARSLALFIHYAPTGEVSGMVRAQLRHLRAQGFAIAFISMAPDLPADTVAALREGCAAVVQRRNFGLDFGAWHDVVPLLLPRTPALEELLLVNDSICGPFRSLDPALAAMRATPGGLFGLTENLAPRPHLQSYFLLTRGAAAIGDIALFLRRHRKTADKRLTIRRGEVGLTAWMRRRGHPVAAWCGYETVEAAALRRPAARNRVRLLYPDLFRDVAEDDASGMARALRRRPLNATHLFWRELVEEFGFPFVKTDLLLRNPLGIADPLAWADLLGPGAEPGAAARIAGHLAGMRARPEADATDQPVAARGEGRGAPGGRAAPAP